MPVWIIGFKVIFKVTKVKIASFVSCHSPNEHSFLINVFYDSHTECRPTVFAIKQSLNLETETES